MKWLFLFSSILCEVVATTCLKLASTNAASMIRYGAAVALFYGLCFVFLMFAMRHFAVSTVYATWSGVGVGLIAVIGVVVFGDEINVIKVVSFLLVIAGIIGLNCSGVSH